MSERPISTRQINTLIRALEECEAALWSVLNQLDQQEIRDSFQPQAKALKKAQSVLLRVKGKKP